MYQHAGTTPSVFRSDGVMQVICPILHAVIERMCPFSPEEGTYKQNKQYISS